MTLRVLYTQGKEKYFCFFFFKQIKSFILCEYGYIKIIKYYYTGHFYIYLFILIFKCNVNSNKNTISEESKSINKRKTIYEKINVTRLQSVFTNNISLQKKVSRRE